MSNYAYRVADEIIEELKSCYGFSDWWYKVPIKTRVSIVERIVGKMEYYDVIKYASTDSSKRNRAMKYDYVAPKKIMPFLIKHNQYNGCNCQRCKLLRIIIRLDRRKQEMKLDKKVKIWVWLMMIALGGIALSALGKLIILLVELSK